MSGVNKVILVGNLGKDPEIRNTGENRNVANFPLATSETYKNKAGVKVTNTEWHNIVVWSPLAEIAEKRLNKGSKIYVEGKLTTRSWEDKDGNKRYTTEVVVRQLTMFGGASNQGSQGAQSNQNEANSEWLQNNSNVEVDDGFPF